MVERVEDLLLPNAVIQRIMKVAIPDGINIAKEARTEISRAASIFILYLSFNASLNTKSRNQKTMSPADLITALGTIEMENFVEPIKEKLEEHRRLQKLKKDRKQKEAPTNGGTEETQEPTEEIQAPPEEMQQQSEEDPNVMEE